MEAAKKLAEEAKAKMTDDEKAAAEKAAKEAEKAEAPQYEWSDGICVAVADCGAVITKELHVKMLKSMPGYKEGEGEWKYECGATTLAASILAAASVAFTM